MPSASERDERPAILYISYNGIGGALARSQVLPYLRALDGPMRFDVLAFDGGAEALPPARELGSVRVHRLSYRRGPRLVAKLFDLIVGTVTAVGIVRASDIRLIHARSHVAATIAAVTGAITGRPFIFDMRGFFGDERAEAGSIGAGGILHRALATAERLLLTHAAAVVVLTERARERLLSLQQYASAVRGKPIVVVPCCVDLGRFGTRDQRVQRLVYLGSVGTWYRLDAMLRFFEHFRALRPGATFVVANQSQHELVRAAVAGTSAGDAVLVRSVPFEEVPALLETCAAGLVLLSEGGSKVASSPIKVAEYLAAGLPVVANAIVGDVPELLRAGRAGIVLEDLGDPELRRGARELVALLEEGPELHARARRLAGDAFDVREGARRYGLLYDELLRGSGA